MRERATKRAQIAIREQLEAILRGRLWTIETQWVGLIWTPLRGRGLSELFALLLREGILKLKAKGSQATGASRYYYANYQP